MDETTRILRTAIADGRIHLHGATWMIRPAANIAGLTVLDEDAELILDEWFETGKIVTGTHSGTASWVS
jgi:hypothetical protein